MCVLVEQSVFKKLYIIGILDDVDDSLFAYNQNDDFFTYHDPTFVPIFVAAIDDREYQQKVTNFCQEDTACIFDIIATGSIEVGLSTLQQTVIITNVSKLSQPSKKTTFIINISL